MTQTIVSHYCWKDILHDDWKINVYPSLVKDIEKSSPILEKYYHYEITDLSTSLAELFITKYIKLIANKSDYHLNFDETLAKIKGKINDSETKFLAVYDQQGVFQGGEIVTVRKQQFASVCYRCFEKLPKIKGCCISLDYWVETVFQQYFINLGIKILKHGRDTNIRRGYVGLPLFKLKYGALPFLSKKPCSLVEFSDNFDEIVEPTLILTNIQPDESLKTVLIIDRNHEIHIDTIKQYQSVCKWTGLEFQLID